MSTGGDNVLSLRRSVDRQSNNKLSDRGLGFHMSSLLDSPEDSTTHDENKQSPAHSTRFFKWKRVVEEKAAVVSASHAPIETDGAGKPKERKLSETAAADILFSMGSVIGPRELRKDRVQTPRIAQFDASRKREQSSQEKIASAVLSIPFFDVSRPTIADRVKRERKQTPRFADFNKTRVGSTVKKVEAEKQQETTSLQKTVKKKTLEKTIEKKKVVKTHAGSKKKKASKVEKKHESTNGTQENGDKKAAKSKSKKPAAKRPAKSSQPKARKVVVKKVKDNTVGKLRQKWRGCAKKTPLSQRAKSQRSTDNAMYKPIKCKVCETVMISHSSRLHVFVHWPLDAPPPFTCPHQCGYGSRYKSSVLRHMALEGHNGVPVKNHDPEVMSRVMSECFEPSDVARETPKIECELCHQLVRRHGRLLREHICIEHKGEDAPRRLRCVVCGHVEDLAYAMRDHMRSHGAMARAPESEETEELIQLEAVLYQRCFPAEPVQDYVRRFLEKKKTVKGQAVIARDAARKTKWVEADRGRRQKVEERMERESQERTETLKQEEEEEETVEQAEQKMEEPDAKEEEQMIKVEVEEEMQIQPVQLMQHSQGQKKKEEEEEYDDELMEEEDEEQKDESMIKVEEEEEADDDDEDEEPMDDDEEEAISEPHFNAAELAAMGLGEQNYVYMGRQRVEEQDEDEMIEVV